MAENSSNAPRLRIDNVLSSQPEIGPQIPDGGYGWVIFCVVFIFKLFIPSVIVAYGIIVMYLLFESDAVEPILWQTSYFCTPLVYMATILIFEPASVALIKENRWPKFISYSGVCLLCAGFLILWYAIHDGFDSTFFYVISGAVSGMGSSIISTLCDTLLSQYFKLKLKNLSGVLKITTFVGYILTPIFLGKLIYRQGVPKGLVWYQVMLLQGTIISMLFRKPDYLKTPQPTTQNYSRLSVNYEDEEDIFSKQATELGCIPTSGNETAKQAADDKAPENMNEGEGVSSQNVSSNAEADVGESSHGQKSNKMKKNWVSFEDETPRRNSTVKEHLHFTFETEENKQENRLDDIVEMPRPLYDIQVNNNTSYSFDTYEELASPHRRESSIFTVQSQRKSFIQTYFNFLTSSKFYMLLILLTNSKFSLFVYFSLMPTYLSNVTDYHIFYNCNILGSVAMIGLAHCCILILLQSTHLKKRELILSVSSFIGSICYVLLSMFDEETWILVCSAGICISLSSFECFGDSLIKMHLRSESKVTFNGLYIFSGLMFLIFVITNITYRYVFVIMGLLQLFSCICWALNIITGNTFY